MAKQPEDEISFDKLSSLNLSIANHVESVEKEVTEPPVPPKAAKPMIKTSFKIERDVHLALKQYCVLQNEEMAKVVFDQIIKDFLKREGYYPPSKGPIV